MAVLDAYTDNPGTWLFHCHLTDHIAGGMMALFHVAGQAPKFTLNGKVRDRERQGWKGQEGKGGGIQAGREIGEQAAAAPAAHRRPPSTQ